MENFNKLIDEDDDTSVEVLSNTFLDGATRLEDLLTKFRMVDLAGLLETMFRAAVKLNDNVESRMNEKGAVLASGVALQRIAIGSGLCKL